jgi:metallophosphoesterase superfamily enzyme
MGGGEELDLAVNRLKRWYKSFPDAYVTIGNHDRMIMRKSQTSHVPRRWIKSYSAVLETPGWQFVDRVDIDGVQYIHGESGTARTKCKSDMVSTVQGHLHTQCYTEWVVGRNMRVFGMQVGCGIDDSSYAMAYAKAGKKSAIGCGVVVDGRTAINKLMDL